MAKTRSEKTGREVFAEVEFKGSSVGIDASGGASSHDPDAEPIVQIAADGDVSVGGLGKKSKVVVEVSPAKMTKDDQGNVSYTKVKGGTVKAVGKRVKDADGEARLLVPVDGAVKFKDPMPPDEVAVLVRARPSRVWALVLLLILALIAIVFAAIVLLDPWGDPRAKRGYYEGKTEAEIQEDLNADVAWHSMVMSVAPYVVLSPGSKECPNFNVENIEANHCDQKFTFKLKDTGEVLYESGAISPGEYIGDIELTRSFDEGVYEGIVEFQGYETDAHLGGGGQIWGHDEFGAPASFEVLIIVTDDQEVANATAQYYLQ